jgi:hypothetical protein
MRREVVAMARQSRNARPASRSLSTARATISRGKFHVGVVARPEALALGVHQPRALAAGLRGQRRERLATSSAVR